MRMPSDILECCIGTAPEKHVDGPIKGITVSVIPSKALPNSSPRPPTEKIFIARDSVLTEIFNTQHGSSLYRICMVLSAITVGSSAAVDLANNDSLNIGQAIIWMNVKGIPLTIVCWLLMMVLVLIVYSLFCLWAIKRSSSTSLTFWDVLFILPVVAMTALLVVLPASGILYLNLAPVCSFGLLMEQLRFFMKVYSFLRVKLPKVIAGDSYPGFTQFVYFLMIPTMIYSDEYPKSGLIRWRFVVKHVMELTWCGVMICFCTARVHAPIISNFRSVWLDAGDAIITFIGTLVPTTLILLAGFFAYFHSFCNLQAELTGFQDRLFYKDWWNATSFRAFFTTWNTLVQDWLYQYVYLDVRKMTGSRTLAAGGVFLASGVVHEYVLSFFFCFFYPVLVIVFVGAGLILKSIPTARVSPTFGNVIMWVCIPIGSGIIVTSYMTEFFSRKNCPYDPEPDWIDFFIPRSWTCPLT